MYIQQFTGMKYYQVNSFVVSDVFHSLLEVLVVGDGLHASVDHPLRALHVGVFTEQIPYKRA